MYPSSPQRTPQLPREKREGVGIEGRREGEKEWLMEGKERKRRHRERGNNIKSCAKITSGRMVTCS